MIITTPMMMRIAGHHSASSGPRFGSQPCFCNRKYVPRPIRMMGPTSELDRMDVSPGVMCPDSVEEGPGIGAVETPDADGFQEFRREVSQVHPMPGTGSGVQGLPVGDNAAGPAAHVAQGPITPDIVFRIPGVTLDGHRAQCVVGPDARDPAAERAVAAGRLRRGEGEREPDGAAMTGPLKRWAHCITHLKEVSRGIR